MYEKYRARGFVVIGINLDSYPELVKRFIDRAHLTYPIGFATNDVLRNYGGMHSIPQSFLVDRNGNIVRQYNGWGALYAYQSERDVRRLLGLEQ
jgi:peroxiredoxin